MENSQSFCKLLFLLVTSCEDFFAVLHVLAFQKKYEKNAKKYVPEKVRKTKWGLKPTSSSKAVGPKKKRLRKVKLSSLRNYRGTTETACIVSVKTKFLVALQSKSWRIKLFQRNIVEKSEVSKLLIESSGENSLLNERPKLLMLQIGNKYPFDA